MCLANCTDVLGRSPCVLHSRSPWRSSPAQHCPLHHTYARPKGIALVDGQGSATKSSFLDAPLPARNLHTHNAVMPIHWQPPYTLDHLPAPRKCQAVLSIVGNASALRRDPYRRSYTASFHGLHLSFRSAHLPSFSILTASGCVGIHATSRSGSHVATSTTVVQHASCQTTLGDLNEWRA